MIPINVKEIFYSIQGEGGRAGEASVFIRLSGCSAQFACYASGVVCDTQFEGGELLSCEDVALRVKALDSGCSWIVWTGGEPLDQLRPEHTAFFRHLGFKQAVETSGAKRCDPDLGFDYIVVSPKVADHVVRKTMGEVWVDELRFVIHAGQAPPLSEVPCDLTYISPHADGDRLNPQNVEAAVAMVLANPRLRLSLPIHKILGVR